MNLPRTIACLFLLAGSAAAQPSASFSLANDRIEVRFGARGIVELRDRNAAPHGLGSDDWTLVLDSTPIRSQTLAAPSARHDEHSATYTYKSGPYTIAVAYELRPGWRFVSKQILVSAPAGKVFRVDQVEVWRMALPRPPDGLYVPRTSHPARGTGDYGAFLRFADGRGLFALVQNPFLSVRREQDTLSVSYRPEMDWQQAWGAFASDRGCLGPYRLAGETLPARMVAEWRLAADPEQPGLDRAEIDAFTECVRAFLLDRHQKAVRLNVGWCENDYQIDVATPEGRAEYKRIFDAASQLGLTHLLYSPGNSALARRDDSTDDWKWEYVLWLGLGQKIRRGEWDVTSSPIPPSVQEMLDYARGRNLRLLAYVYPVLPFQQDPAWLVRGSTHHAADLNATLGSRAFQDWLISTLVAFYRRTGIGGYAFDYTYFFYPGTSGYAQWHGWRRVLESLRRQLPDIVIDGRQSYMQHGPWTWLAGSYPHPTATDEQPESFVPFPDLHFDRVSAARERYTAYWYRNHEFTPTELVPGFIGHQTPRSDGRDVPLTRFRARDWDYLGWRYSLLSSIAVAGLNHVVNMIPARDPQEFRNFSAQDQQWLRRWLDWTDQHRDDLLRTRTILGQPQLGRADGTAMVRGDRGFVFLFNPNARKVSAEFTLDPTIGLEQRGRYLLKQLHPVEGALVGQEGKGFWDFGDRVAIELDGASAMVLELSPAPADDVALLFNAPGTVSIRGADVVLANVSGEPGTERTLLVALPGASGPRRVLVNGASVPFRQNGNLITAAVRFAGEPFGHSQQAGQYDPNFSGGTFTATFRVPSRILRQLEARRRAWPIAWTAEDLDTPWLAPERLLLFVQIAEPTPDMQVTLTVDDQPVELKKAYSSIWPNPRSFVGFYADVTRLAPDRQHRLSLTLPALRPGQFQGAFFDNVEPEYTTALAPAAPAPARR